MVQIFTSRNLSAGQVFDFYSFDVRLQGEDIIEIWSERGNGGLGDPIIYGKARVTHVPYHPTHIYKAMVLSGEK